MEMTVILTFSGHVHGWNLFGMKSGKLWLDFCRILFIKNGLALMYWSLDGYRGRNFCHGDTNLPPETKHASVSLKVEEMDHV